LITPPYDEKLNIGVLSRIFDRNRITNSYKYFWFMAILKKISNGQSEFTYDELVDQMVVDAWYMVTEYNLRLGPNGIADYLEETAKYIFNKERFCSTSKEEDLLVYLEETEDPNIRKFKKDYLIQNVPYCLQSPFYPDIRDLGRSKTDLINQRPHLLYYFVTLAGLDSKIRINGDWQDYLLKNKDILMAWVKYNLAGFLQDRNPNVPGILDKLEKPEKRNLARVSKYWEVILIKDHSIRDIYGDIAMSDEKISIDHFVPWQYVASDELWNLSPTTRSINSKKGNHLPVFDTYFRKLAAIEYKAYQVCRNDETARTAYNECLEYHVNSDAVRRNLYADDLDETGFENALREIVKPVYDSAKMCGFSEWEYSAAI
jgi:hypothetical protein